MTNNQIESSLLYGGIATKKQVALVIFAITISLLLTLAIIIIIAYERDFDSIYYIIVPIVFVVGFLIILIDMISIRHKINVWLADAVELCGDCSYSVDDLKKSDGTCKIAITFEYDGKTLVRTSGSQNYHPLTWARDGYQKIFRKYVGKKIKILYSPTYDEIMIPYQ